MREREFVKRITYPIYVLRYPTDGKKAGMRRIGRGSRSFGLEAKKNAARETAFPRYPTSFHTDLSLQQPLI
jgi:hypothetical protein